MMDWSQASVFELMVFGIGISMVLAIIAILAVMIFSVVWNGLKNAIRRHRRKKKTTVALSCGACQYNVEDGNFRRCEQFGVNISCAPVIYPGCSWGIEKKAVGR